MLRCFTIGPVLLAVALWGGAAAQDTGNAWTGNKRGQPEHFDRGTPDGREGGEVIETAFIIPGLPFTDTGNTCDNLDDYDVMCPNAGQGPDVVYRFTPPALMQIDIDLCGSSYDTKLYISQGFGYPAVPVACNDDYYFPGDPCGGWVSRLDGVWLQGGQTYHIFVDGYGQECGDYVLEVTEHQMCLVQCPAGAGAEGEPPLVPDYVDEFNGGCNSDPPVFSTLHSTEPPACTTVCGVSGWYDFSGQGYRDTDWYEIRTAGTLLEWTVDAEFPVRMYVILPDCGSTQVVRQATAGPCEPATIDFAVQAGQVYWLWVGPTVFSGPVAEFDYTMTVCGLLPVSGERTSWGTVKELYR